jgi:lysophospholipase L1-like esterase
MWVRIQSTLKYFIILYILLSYHTAWGQVSKPINLVFLAFGDSITYGMGSSSDGPDTGYPKLLEEKLKSLYRGPIKSINRGNPGETTYGGAKRFEQEVIANNPNLILLMEGTNDEYFGIPYDDTENNLRSMVEIALYYGKKIIIGTIPPVISNSYVNRSDQEARIEAFNPRIYTIAEDYGIPVAQVFESITSVPDWENLLMDQLSANHPNDAGYEVVRDAFCAPIVELINSGIFYIPESLGPIYMLLLSD